MLTILIRIEKPNRDLLGHQLEATLVVEVCEVASKAEEATTTRWVVVEVAAVVVVVVHLEAAADSSTSPTSVLPSYMDFHFGMRY